MDTQPELTDAPELTQTLVPQTQQPVDSPPQEQPEDDDTIAPSEDEEESDDDAAVDAEPFPTDLPARGGTFSRSIPGRAPREYDELPLQGRPLDAVDLALQEELTHECWGMENERGILLVTQTRRIVACAEKMLYKWRIKLRTFEEQLKADCEAQAAKEAAEYAARQQAYRERQAAAAQKPAAQPGSKGPPYIHGAATLSRHPTFANNPNQASFPSVRRS